MTRVARHDTAATPREVVKALSLWEPWASLMATGAKRNETRHWPTHYRGPLLICAAKRRVKGELEWQLEDGLFQGGLAPLVGRPLALEAEFSYQAGVEIDHLQFGMAVALVDLVDVVPTDDLQVTEAERAFGNYGDGRFAWITENRRRIEPFPVTGRQGLFEVAMPAGLTPGSGGSGTPPFAQLHLDFVRAAP